MSLPPLTDRAIGCDQFEAVSIGAELESINELYFFRTKADAFSDVSVAESIVANRSINSSISNRSDAAVVALDLSGISRDLNIGNRSQSATDFCGGTQKEKRLATLDRLGRFQRFVTDTARNCSQPVLSAVMGRGVDFMGFRPQWHRSVAIHVQPVFRGSLMATNQDQRDQQNGQRYFHTQKDKKPIGKIQRKEVAP